MLHQLWIDDGFGHDGLHLGTAFGRLENASRAARYAEPVSLDAWPPNHYKTVILEWWAQALASPRMPVPPEDKASLESGSAKTHELGHSFLNDPLDPETLPEGLRAAWERLAWSQLAPFRHLCKARVFSALDGEQRVVCKDYSYGLAHSRMRWLRRMALRSELRALRRLDDVQGVPRLLDAWDSGFVMEWVPGRRLGDLERDGVPAQVFDSLDRLLDTIHGKGVLIIDLHRRNVMVDDDLSVSLVDFEASLVVDAGVGRLARRQLLRMDDYSAVKQRAHYGARLSPEQERLLTRPPGLRRLLGRIKGAQRARRKRRPPRS